MRTRLLVRYLAVALLAAGLAVPLAGGTAQARPSSSVWPSHIPLPDGFMPEGITIGHGHLAYLGSRANGDIYSVDVRTGQRSLVSHGLGPAFPSVGLKADQRGRLFVAGGPAGTGRVIDVRTGAILADYTFTTNASFINDVVLTKNFAWFTDSQQAQLYGVPLRPKGVAPQSAVVTLPLTGDWEQQPGLNANGIAQTPDGRALLVVQTATGELFRVVPTTGMAQLVDLGATRLINGDGLLVRGQTLYAVQNLSNQVSVVRLNASGTRGTLVRTLTTPDFDVPTTVAIFGHNLYLPNARFTTPATPTTPYWVTRVDTKQG